MTADRFEFLEEMGDAIESFEEAARATLIFLSTATATHSLRKEPSYFATSNVRRPQNCGHFSTSRYGLFDGTFK